MSNTLAGARRREFATESPEIAREILQGARYGHLASVSSDGMPEIRPLNYVLHKNEIVFHTSPKGDLPTWAGRIATMAAEDSTCWLPSYWRNRELACPATTYYRSVLARGVLRSLAEEEKPAAMQAFMERYQPEGGHKPLTHKVYKGPLAALFLVALPLASVSCKLKFGQHLTPALRLAMVEALVERNGRGDRAAARAIRLYNEMDCAYTGYTFDTTLIDRERVWELLRDTYWGHRRTREGVYQQCDEAMLTVAYLEEGRLLGYARLARVDRRTGFLYDVIIDADHRGKGIGKGMMERLMAQVQPLERILLDTRDAMGLYQRYGFEVISVSDEGSSMMLWRR